MSMTDEKVKIINELYHKAKAEGLTEAEKKEQAVLREEYVASFRRFISYSSFFLPSTFRSAQRPQQKAQPKQMPLPVVHSSYS